MYIKFISALIIFATLAVLVEGWGAIQKLDKEKIAEKVRDKYSSDKYKKKDKYTQTSEEQTSHRIIKLNEKDGQKFAEALNEKRSKLAKGLRKFHLKYASKMYKTEWNPTLASTAKEMLKVRPTPVSFVVMLREIKRDLDIFLAALDSYFYELADHGIVCEGYKCIKKRVKTDTGLKLTLPYELAYSKTAKIGCAVEYWKNEKSVQTAKLIGRKEKNYRARMICQSPLVVNEILYEVGKPCKACEEEHSCDKNAGMCMTEGYKKRHPSITSSSSSDETVKHKIRSRL